MLSRQCTVLFRNLQNVCTSVSSSQWDLHALSSCYQYLSMYCTDTNMVVCHANMTVGIPGNVAQSSVDHALLL